MSTKTTFKRIALVAVAALGLSLVAVAPSNAVALQKITLGSVAGVQTTTGTTKIAVTTLVNFNGYCTYQGDTAVYQAVYTALPATSKVALPALTNLAYTDNTYSQLSSFYQAGNGNAPYSYFQQKGYTVANNVVTNAGSTFEVEQKCEQSGRYNVYATLSFTPDVAGTYSIMVQDPQAAYTQTTWTVVVTDPTVKSIKAFLNTDSSTALTADASSLVYTAASSVTAKGALTVQQYSTTDTATVAVTAITQAVTVTIDKGLVSKTNDYFAGAKSVTTAAAGSTAGLSTYYVFANGEVGTATLTVTVGALTSTKTITFQGVATSLSAALTASQPTWIALTGTTTVTVTAKDSAGNAAANTPTITATPASTAIATATVNGLVVTITGVAAGTTVVTIADAATTAPATSTTYTVTVAPAVSATLPTLTFDKAEYAAGELMTITVGAAAADNATFAAFTSAGVASSVNLVTVKNPFAASTSTVALVAGKATWTAYAPITAGPITLTAMSGTGSSLTSAAVTATATVVSDGVAQAAADAAAEATDAANAATDAANAAAEAADAATAAAQDAADAVAALSTQVSEMVDALKKQITALTNLVIKIQKKVRA
jgi:hypothetical protein